MEPDAIRTYMCIDDFSKYLFVCTQAGWSPLMVAAEHGHPEVVEILLNNNARIDLFDEVKQIHIFRDI